MAQVFWSARNTHTAKLARFIVCIFFRSFGREEKKKLKYKEKVKQVRSLKLVGRLGLLSSIQLLACLSFITLFVYLSVRASRRSFYLFCAFFSFFFCFALVLFHNSSHAYCFMKGNKTEDYCFCGMCHLFCAKLSLFSNCLFFFFFFISCV